MTRATLVHVEPGRGGRWIVREDDEPAPRSEHASATDAERVAWRDGASVVMLRDRYGRVRRLYRDGLSPERPRPDAA